MENILYLFAIYGLAFFIKDSDGPFGIMSWFRNKLMTNSWCGFFFYKFFSCYFCVGTHAGYIMYLLATPYKLYNLHNLIIWSFAGAAFSLLIHIISEKINHQST